MSRKLKDTVQFNTIFPPTIFVEINSIVEQKKHLISEMNEYYEACVEMIHGKCSCEKVVEELMDIIHSAETLLRMYEAEGIDVASIQEKVIEKNEKRGYYIKEFEEIVGIERRW